jgi:hypothetical protein
VVEGTNRLERSDVLIGEVWLASGQSNMQWSVEASDSAAAEIAVADYPQLRLFSIKREVGRRLALWALARTYGRDRLVYSGPLVAEAMAEPGAVRLRFDHVGNGLAARDGQPLSWFEMAAADGRFRPALARIDGSTIVLTSPEVTAPVQARLGWSEEASPNLINREGLPASPFWIEVRSR